MTTRRRSHCQCEMRPILVVIADVLFDQELQVPLIEDDHVVEQIPAAICDTAFSDAVPPRTSEAGSLRLDSTATKSTIGRTPEVVMHRHALEFSNGSGSILHGDHLSPRQMRCRPAELPTW